MLLPLALDQRLAFAGDPRTLGGIKHACAQHIAVALRSNAVRSAAFILKVASMVVRPGRRER
jgi:hypothetical protein